MTKPREILRLECGTGADICDEDSYWVADEAEDLEHPAVVTILIAKGTPLPVSSTLLTMAADVLLSEAIDEDEDEDDTHIGAN